MYLDGKSLCVKRGVLWNTHHEIECSAGAILAADVGAEARTIIVQQRLVLALHCIVGTLS